MDDLQRIAEMFLRALFAEDKVKAQPSLTEINRITEAFDRMIIHGWMLRLRTLHGIACRDSETLDALRANPAFNELETAMNDIVETHRKEK